MGINGGVCVRKGGFDVQFLLLIITVLFVLDMPANFFDFFCELDVKDNGLSKPMAEIGGVIIMHVN